MGPAHLPSKFHPTTHVHHHSNEVKFSVSYLLARITNSRQFQLVGTCKIDSYLRMCRQSSPPMAIISIRTTAWGVLKGEDNRFSLRIWHSGCHTCNLSRIGPIPLGHEEGFQRVGSHLRKIWNWELLRNDHLQWIFGSVVFALLNQMYFLLDCNHGVDEAVHLGLVLTLCGLDHQAVAHWLNFHRIAS